MRVIRFERLFSLLNLRRMSIGIRRAIFLEEKVTGEEPSD